MLGQGKDKDMDKDKDIVKLSWMIARRLNLKLTGKFFIDRPIQFDIFN